MNMSSTQLVMVFIIMMIVIGCLPMMFKCQSRCNRRFVLHGHGYKEDAEEMLKKLADWDDSLQALVQQQKQLIITMPDLRKDVSDFIEKHSKHFTEEHKTANDEVQSLKREVDELNKKLVLQQAHLFRADRKEQSLKNQESDQNQEKGCDKCESQLGVEKCSACMQHFQIGINLCGNPGHSLCYTCLCAHVIAQADIQLTKQTEVILVKCPTCNQAADLQMLDDYLIRLNKAKDQNDQVANHLRTYGKQYTKDESQPNAPIQASDNPNISTLFTLSIPKDQILHALQVVKRTKDIIQAYSANAPINHQDSEAVTLKSRIDQVIEGVVRGFNRVFNDDRSKSQHRPSYKWISKHVAEWHGQEAAQLQKFKDALVRNNQDELWTLMNEITQEDFNRDPITITQIMLPFVRVQQGKLTLNEPNITPQYSKLKVHLKALREGVNTLKKYIEPVRPQSQGWTENKEILFDLLIYHLNRVHRFIVLSLDEQGARPDPELYRESLTMVQDITRTLQ